MRLVWIFNVLLFNLFILFFYTLVDFHWVKSEIFSTLEIPKKTKKCLEISYFLGFRDDRKSQIFKIWKCHYVTFTKFPRLWNFKFLGLSKVLNFIFFGFFEQWEDQVFQIWKCHYVTFTKFQKPLNFKFPAIFKNL